jgi:hypothetical protein
MDHKLSQDSVEKWESFVESQNIKDVAPVDLSQIQQLTEPKKFSVKLLIFTITMIFDMDTLTGTVSISVFDTILGSGTISPTQPLNLNFNIGIASGSIEMRFQGTTIQCEASYTTITGGGKSTGWVTIYTFSNLKKNQSKFLQIERGQSTITIKGDGIITSSDSPIKYLEIIESKMFDKLIVPIQIQNTSLIFTNYLENSFIDTHKQVGEGVKVIITGKFELTYTNPKDNKKIIITTLNPGDWAYLGDNVSWSMRTIIPGSVGSAY